MKNRIKKIQEEYGLSSNQASVLLASQTTVVAKQIVAGVKSLNKVVEGIKDPVQAQLTRDAQVTRNKFAINLLMEQAATQVLVANELNTGLINIVGEVEINDGLNVTDRYAVYERTASEFGQLNFIYGMDILRIAAWTGTYIIDLANPQIVLLHLNKMDTEDKISMGYRNNSSVYGGAFNNSEERINVLSAEAKKANDTIIAYFNVVYAQDIEDNVKIGRFIPGFDSEADIAESMDIINETKLLMFNEQRQFNERGFKRATGGVENLVLIGNAKYFAKTRRDLAGDFFPALVDNQLGIKNIILENNFSSLTKVILTAKTFYNKNTRVSQISSRYQDETGNTVNWQHHFRRRGVAIDQQALFFDTTVPNVSFLTKPDISASTVTLEITNNSTTAITVIGQLIKLDDKNQTVEADSGDVAVAGETTVDIVVDATAIGEKILRVVQKTTNIILYQDLVEITALTLTVKKETTKKGNEISQNDLKNIVKSAAKEGYINAKLEFDDALRKAKAEFAKERITNEQQQPETSAKEEDSAKPEESTESAKSNK